MADPQRETKRRTMRLDEPEQLANSIARCAERLDTNPRAIYKAIQDGRLRSFKLGKRRLVPETDLRAFARELAGGAE